MVEPLRICHLEDKQCVFLKVKTPAYEDLDQKQICRVCGNSTDNTELELAQESLRESEIKSRKLSLEFRSLLNAIPDSMKLVDRDLKVVWANESALAEIGASAEDINDRHCFNLWCGNTEPCTLCPTLQTFRTGKTTNQTVTLDNNKVWDLRAIPFRYEQGQIVSVIELKRDITEHRSLELQLRHAQKMEAFGALAGGVAHDFNNILSVIMGYGDMVLSKLEADSAPRAQMLEVLAAAERAANLTRQLMLFSRKQVVEMVRVDSNNIISGVSKMLSRLIGEHIDMQIHLADRQLTVLADMGQIEQVLMNLATNSRDAMPNGGVITIATQAVQLDTRFVEINKYGKPGNYAVISVADTGIGMDAETQKKIYDPFFTTKGIGQGTGLGLAISYGIIKQHNGYIDCSSEPGNGTVFKIYLPLAEDSSLPAENTAATTSAPCGSETILLAEDDPSVRELTKIILEAFGYSVLTANNGEAAVSMFLENRNIVQLVIFDLIMPKINGADAFEEIKKINPEMKALFLSGYTEEIISSMMTGKNKGFLQKPVNPNELIRKVREVLDL